MLPYFKISQQQISIFGEKNDITSEIYRLVLVFLLHNRK